MSQTYYTILTKLGTELLANATALGVPLKLTSMAVGDGNGSIPKPITTQTALVNEVRRASLNSLSVDKNNPNQIIAEQVIPENEGGWFIHEIGLYDDKGNLIAVGNCPPTYKPKLAEGSGRTQVIRMIIIVGNVDSVALKIDPAVVLATREYVDRLIATKMEEHKESTNHPDATIKSKGFVQLNSATNSNIENQAATPKAVKATYDLATAAKKVAEIQATTSSVGRVKLSSAIDSSSETEAATSKAVRDAFNYAQYSDSKAQSAYDHASSAHNRITDVHNYAKNVNENVNNAHNRITNVNDNVTKIIDRFQSLPFESVVFSPDHQYHATVRNDGIFGFFDKNSIHKNLCWAVDRNGGLVHGYVDVSKITGLEQFIFNNFFPVGIPMPWPTTTPPPGWMVCNGWGFNRSEYPLLARAYPNGILPELRGEIVRGLDAGRGVDPDRVILSWQGDAIRNLTGTFGFESAISGATGSANVSGAFYAVEDNSRRHLSAGTGGNNTLVVFDASRQTPVAHEVRQRNVAFLYIVRAA
ncbi:hypothetical protein A9G28_12880 [Gilliamella sp. Fer1-1]|uniref:phage tail protein n=1 Tax=Gilliamella sp. Fer1-1 TaxID=3120240 RepID=UPI00080DD49F|nr:phage tail protein [Gilliamella apicola]OCG45165.1 hypothetical protein A9G28_12880 [Gilliamella apicola]